MQPFTLNRQLEARNIPFVFETQQSLYPGESNDYTADILTDLYKNISSYWMSTATIQLALNGSEPAWSKDGWSFVPIDLKNITAAKSLSTIGATKADNANRQPQTNVTLDTSAIRGRIECSPPSQQVMRNISNWLTAVDISNHTIYNASTIPSGLQGGYRLGNGYNNRNTPGMITPLLPSQNWTECLGCTTVFVNPSAIKCCGNSSSNTDEESVAIGYWSPNIDTEHITPRAWQRNFTAKWFHGDAYTGIKARNDSYSARKAEDPLMLFPSPPSVSMLNCMPIVEEANATITVNPTNGEVQSFSIKDKPAPVSEAWNDPFLPHNSSTTVEEMREGYTSYNVTLR